MRVGVPKEIKSDEYRVGMMPVGAEALVKRGHEVLVETGAGVGSGFPDEAYQAVGATMVKGDFGLTMSDTFALHDTNLRFANFDTRLAEQLVAGFKSPRRGSLSGRAAVNGGKNALRVDA